MKNTDAGEMRLFEDQSDDALIELMESVRSAPENERWGALLWWARSPYWHAALMLCGGWQGEIARAAYRTLRAELQNDTPGRRWDHADHALGRASINRLLGLEDDPSAAYASAPFRTIIDDDGRAWIGGAVGCPCYLTAEYWLGWEHLDIRDVILLDPRSGASRIAGDEYGSAQMVLPDVPDDPLVVYGEPLAYFRAWADLRAKRCDNARHSRIGEWAHGISETRDSGLPGALVVGSINDVRWPDLSVSEVVAANGLTSVDLRSAAFRSARLPIFREGLGARV